MSRSRACPPAAFCLAALVALACAAPLATAAPAAPAARAARAAASARAARAAATAHAAHAAAGSVREADPSGGPAAVSPWPIGFPDPVPVSTDPRLHNPPAGFATHRYFTGTFDNLMTCELPVVAGACTDSHLNITVKPGTLLARELNGVPRRGATPARAPVEKVCGYWNKAMYQEPDLTAAQPAERWQMVAVASLVPARVSCKNLDLSQGWRALVHLQPASVPSYGPPTDWQLTNVMVGSPTPPRSYVSAMGRRLVTGNVDAEDGRLFSYDGTPYLVYGRSTAPGANPLCSPTFQTGVSVQPTVKLNIVAVPLDRDYATVRAGAKPVTLLGPGAYQSEFRNSCPPGYQDHFMLTEAPSITEVDGVWVMLYSVGDYASDNYKLGIAYSLNPLSGWTKATTDGGTRVQYLLQGMDRNCPGYTANVLSPGVGSLGQDIDGDYLYFAGRIRGPQPRHTHAFKPGDRVDYVARIQFHIPSPLPADLSTLPAGTLASWASVDGVDAQGADPRQCPLDVDG